jgi:hypothetical protein
VSKWLNGRIQGRPNIERTLYSTEDAAIDGLSKAVKAHCERGRRERDAWRGPKYVCEVVDQDGHVVAVYWLSDEDNTPEP